MAEEDKPWRRLFHAEQQEQEQQQHAAGAADERQQAAPQQHQPPDQQQLSELQQQLLDAYRKTCLVAGAGLAGSAWAWHAKHNRPGSSSSSSSGRDVFLPPRAQALPKEVVEAWVRKARLRAALQHVGRQTLFISGVAGLYFGAELAAGLATGKVGDWGNTAAAGALAGGVLGARAPSSQRARTMLLGTAAGGLLGALSGWSQQQLVRLLASEEAQQPQRQHAPTPTAKS